MFEGILVEFKYWEFFFFRILKFLNFVGNRDKGWDLEERIFCFEVYREIKIIWNLLI